MISDKKLEANRRNALKSTGPKTPEGKAISAQNGLTHGLTAQKHPILPGEDPQAFEALHDALVCDLKPRGILQRELVWDLTLIRWKLRRLPRIEAEIVDREQASFAKKYSQETKWARARKDKAWDFDAPPPNSAVEVLADHLGETDDRYERIELHRQRLERTMLAILREFRRLRADQADQPEEEELKIPKVQPVSQEPARESQTRCRKTEPTDERKRIKSFNLEADELPGNQDSSRESDDFGPPDVPGDEAPGRLNGP